MPITPRQALTIVGLAALTVHASLWMLPLIQLDRLFMPDDTYYTLSISRNMARGLGPSTDGINVTTGFQPLIALLQAPLANIIPTPDTLVQAAVALSGVFGVLTCVVAARLVQQITSSAPAALLTGLLMTVTPAVISNHLNGLETSLASLLLLLCIQQMHALTQDGSTSKVFGAMRIGALCGLALLARIDSCFVVGLLGVWSLATLPWRATLLIVITALCVVSPWWVYCWIHTGSVVPESGSAVRQIVQDHQSLHLTPAKTVQLAAQALTGLLVESRQPWVSWVLGALLIPLLSVRDVPRRLMSAALIAMLTFYVAYLPAFWFFERYFHPVYVFLIVLAGCRLGDALGHSSHGAPKPFFSLINRRSLSLITASLMLLMLCIQVVRLSAFWQPTEAQRPFVYGGAKGYGEVGKAIAQQLQPGTVIGAMQSGSLAFHAPMGVRVLNLDGVVSKQAALAIRHRTLGNYAVDQGMTHFADWQHNLGMLERHSTNGVSLRLTELMSFKPQGIDKFTLYRVN